jgi:hypothetical protein
MSEKLGEIIILSLDEKSFGFFTDILSISCEPVKGVEGHYSNCSDKDPMELKPRNKDLAKLQKLYLIEQKQPHQELIWKYIQK